MSIDQNNTLSNLRIEAEEDLQVHPDALLPALPDGDLWVFGYGSLMWRQGFDSAVQLNGRLYGYHRALCVSSHVHRGTSDIPGLVLGLDRGGSCSGRLFKVSEKNKPQVASYLFSREMPTAVYLAKLLPVHCPDGTIVTALTFVVDRHHPQYVTNTTALELATIVVKAKGISGSSSDYLLATLQQLRSRNLKDKKLEAIAQHLAYFSD